MWIAVIGPETPDLGEVTDTAPVHQSDVAATILKLLGLDYRELDPEAGPAIGVAFSDSEGRAT